jgi:hypothetical protein
MNPCIIPLQAMKFLFLIEQSPHIFPYYRLSIMIIIMKKIIKSKLTILLKRKIDMRCSSATAFTWPQVSLSMPSILMYLVLVTKLFAGLAIGVTCLGAIIQLLFIPFRLWLFSRESLLIKIFLVFVSCS